jgi:hypothetical protein
MKTSLWTSGVAAFATLSLALGGCGGGGGGLSGGGGGGGGGGETLRVLITDAPFPFDYVASASVVINEVRVHEATSDAWSTVFTGSETIDLVPLTNGVAMLLVEAAVPVGTYDMVRLIVDAGEVVLTEDAVVQDDNVFNTEGGDLFFPSGAQTGIKMNIENDIVVTTQLSGDLILDFDLANNFVFNGPVSHAPGVRRVIFTPHVKATNASTNGSLTLRAMSDSLTPGVVGDDVPIEGATVSVFTSPADFAVDTPVATAPTDALGIATISLLPGTYDVLVEAAGHEPGSFLGATVVVANLTDIGDITLAATGTITGVVMSDAATLDDAADDVVVEGATINVYDAGTTNLVGTAVSDVNGAFQVAPLASGNYDVVVTKAGFDDLTTAGVAASISGTGDTYLLHALSSNVTGTVTLLSDGTDVSGAAVEVVNSAGVLVASTTTAADGTYALTLGTGHYTFTFSSAGLGDVKEVDVLGANPASATTVDAALQ